MFRIEISYDDFDGNRVVDTFYFHLSKVEIAELEVSHTEGLSVYLRGLVEAKSGSEIISNMKAIVEKAIGRRSEDGKRFYKNDDIRSEFFESNAWPEFFMTTLTSSTGALEFVKAVIPADLSNKLDENPEFKKELEGVVVASEDPAKVKELDAYTYAELISMSKSDFDNLVGYDSRSWSQTVLKAAFERRMSNRTSSGG